MKKYFLFLLAAALLLGGCAAKETPAPDTNSSANSNLNQPMSSQDQLQQLISKLGHEDLLSQYNGAILKTNLGDIKVKFYNEDSPLTVNNFLNLAKTNFYNETKFHRVINDFMIQGGDPNSKDDDWSNDGMGGPAYKFKDEINQHKLVRGSLAMANSGKNTNGSQFFIVTKYATPWLDGLHTNFGEVVEGMDVVDKIEALEKDANDHPLKDATIKSIELIKL